MVQFIGPPLLGGSWDLAATENRAYDMSLQVKVSENEGLSSLFSKPTDLQPSVPLSLSVSRFPLPPSLPPPLPLSLSLSVSLSLSLSLAFSLSLSLAFSLSLSHSLSLSLSFSLSLPRSLRL